MSVIMNKPTFVESLPANQRPALSARTSDLENQVTAFVAKLDNHRDKWALAAKGLSSTSTVYEAFRKAGCEVKLVVQTDPQTGQAIVERRRNSKGVESDYPVKDVFVMLPAGEIKNRSGRKPWVAPAKRLEGLRNELAAIDRLPEGHVDRDGRRNEVELSIQVLLERNPKLRNGASPTA